MKYNYTIEEIINLLDSQNRPYFFTISMITKNKYDRQALYNVFEKFDYEFVDLDDEPFNKVMFGLAIEIKRFIRENRYSKIYYYQEDIVHPDKRWGKLVLRINNKEKRKKFVQIVENYILMIKINGEPIDFNKQTLEE